MGLTGWNIYRHSDGMPTEMAKEALSLHLLQLIFSFTWTPVFFGLGHMAGVRRVLYQDTYIVEYRHYFCFGQDVDTSSKAFASWVFYGRPFVHADML